MLLWLKLELLWLVFRTYIWPQAELSHPYIPNLHEPSRANYRVDQKAPVEFLQLGTFKRAIFFIFLKISYQEFHQLSFAPIHRKKNKKYFPFEGPQLKKVVLGEVCRDFLVDGMRLVIN